MNTQVGKSVGIALLLAAGLLAVLFAFGVFAPGADTKADVRGGVAKPVIELSDYRLAQEVTLTITFQVDVAISSAAREVTVTLPQDLNAATGFDADDNITLKQGSTDVGGITYTDGAGTIEISVPGDDSDREIVEANTPTILRVTKLMTPATAPGAAQTLTIVQEGQVASASVGTSKAFTFGPSVTSASANLTSGVAGASDTLTLTFRTDTHSTATDTDNNEEIEADEVANGVTIVLPEPYDIDTDGPYVITGTCDDREDDCNESGDTGGTDTSGGAIRVSGDAGYVFPDAPNDTGSQVIIHSFGTATSNPTVTVTITGVTNPEGTVKRDIEFRQTGTEAQEKATVYITDKAEIGINDPDGDPGVDISSVEARESDVTLSFKFKAVLAGDADPGITIDLHEDFAYDGDKKSVTVQQMGDDGNEVDVAHMVDYNSKTDSKDFSITLVEDDDPADDAEVTAEAGKDVYVTIMGLTNPGTVGSGIVLVMVDQGGYASVDVPQLLTGVQVSTTTAGAAVRVKISTMADNAIPAGEDVIVNLPGFTLPDSIAREQVLFHGGTGGFLGNPASIAVGSKKVTLALPISHPSGLPVLIGVPAGDVYTITFKLGAGLKNQTVKTGDRDIGASDAPITNTDLDVTSKVDSHAVSRGELVTFSVVGLKAGSATIYLMQGGCIDVEDDCLDANDDPQDDDFRIGGGLQEGGKVEVDRRVTSTLFQANAYGRGPTELNADKDGLLGTNIIYSVDGTGVLSDANGRVTILPTVDAAPESIKQGGLLELELSDWYYDSVTAIEVAGVPITHEWTGGRAVTFTHQQVGGDGEADFIVVMPPGVRLGEQQLKLTGTTVNRQGSLTSPDTYTTFITVDPLDLEVSPLNDDGDPEVVINQEFTIEGKGFNTNEGACILSVKFGDVVLRETTAGLKVNCNVGDNVKPDTAGNFSATFRLDPDLGGVPNLKIGEYRVEVKDNEERVGLIDVLIPEPVVEVEPEESRRGSTVTVVGSKFPASPELAVEIRYGLSGNEKTIGAATPDSGGNFRATFTVPTTAVIGEDHVVLAAPIEEAFNHFEGKGTHRLPEQMVVVNPKRVAAGGRMNLEGHNMPLFTLVGVDISGIGVSGVGFETDGIGHFTKDNILVPQLQPGIHTITAKVQTQGGIVEVRTSVEVADIVTRPTDEVFEDLITAGILTVVWRYDNASGAWASYDPAAPAEVNDLDLVSTDDIVWVQTTADYDFQGKSYLAGWNLYSLE